MGVGGLWIGSPLSSCGLRILIATKKMAEADDLPRQKRRENIVISNINIVLTTS